MKVESFSRYFLWLFYVFFLLIGLVPSVFAMSSSSMSAASGHDPWALFQILLGVGSEIWYVIKIALLISGIAGIVFIIMGLQKIRAHATDAQSSGHLKHGVILVIIGGLLFGTPVLTMLVGNSLFGSAPAPVVSQRYVNCQMVNGMYDAGCGANPTECTNGTVGADGSCLCKPGSGGAGCLPCPEGSASQGGIGAGCETCLQNEVVSNNECVCPGGAPVNGACPCPSGSYTDPTGACVTTCPNGSGSSPSSTSCVPCPAGQGTEGIDFSTGLAGGTCQPCPSEYGWGYVEGTPAGFCKLCRSDTGSVNGMCVTCPQNTFIYNNPGGVCMPCPANSTSTPGSSACVCSGGGAFSINANGVGVCPCGLSDYSPTNIACPCGSDKFSNGSPAYPNCPAGKTSFTFSMTGSGGSAVGCEVQANIPGHDIGIFGSNGTIAEYTTGGDTQRQPVPSDCVLSSPQVSSDGNVNDPNNYYYGETIICTQTTSLGCTPDNSGCCPQGVLVSS
jgi:hypothetical protein